MLGWGMRGHEAAQAVFGDRGQKAACLFRREGHEAAQALFGVGG